MRVDLHARLPRAGQRIVCLGALYVISVA